MNANNATDPAPATPLQEKLVAVRLNPTIPQTPEVLAALDRTKDFRQTISQAGFFELDPETIDSSKAQGITPLDYQEGELAAAFNLYAKGAKSEKLAQATQSAAIPQQAKDSLFRQAHLLEVLEAANINEVPASEEVFLANQSPDIIVERIPTTTSPSANQVLFKPHLGSLRPILSEAKGAAVDFAKSKAKDLAVKAIKAGGKRLLKEGAKIAAKTGVKLATKAGIQATLQTIGSSVPVIGNALAAVLGFVLTDVLPWIAKRVGGLFSGILRAITGEKDFRKQMFWLALGGSAIFLGLGIIPLAILSGLAALGFAASIVGGAAIVGGALAIPHAIWIAIMALVVPAIAVPIIIAVISVPLIVAFILFIINSGALMVPPRSDFIPGEVKSAYIEVTKTVSSTDPSDCQPNSSNPSFLDCENDDLPIEAEYTITVRAERGTLTNITFQNTCSVAKEGSVPSCDHPTPTPPTIISATQPFNFTYTQTYGGEFTDSLIIDTFAVTADVESEQVFGTTSAGSATVQIGNPPTDCPQQWPVLPQFGEQKLYVKQGPHTSGGTHDRIEAIDIFSQPSSNFVGHEITSAHTGTVRVGNYGNYGDFVDVTSMCTIPNGTLQVTSRYAHLNTIAVSTGQHVTFGQFLGTGGSSGTGTPHLHYEFRPPPGPIPMDPPYLPKVVPDGCYDYIGRPCNVEIP